MAGSLTRKTLNGAAWIGGASVVRLGLRIVSVAILARLLTPKEYGVMAGALVAAEFATMIYTLGLAPALIQRKEVRPDHVATAFSTSLAMATIAGAGMWFASSWAADLMRIPELDRILKVLAFVAPLGAFNTLCEALLARNMQAKSIAVRPLVSFVVATFFVAIPLAYAGYSYWSLVAMNFADAIFGATAFAFAARKLLVRPGFSRKAFRELWPMSLGFLLNRPFIFISSNADNFLIARLNGADALGLYSRASFLRTNISTLFESIARATMFPAMAQIQHDQERLQNAVLKTLSSAALLTLPVSAFSVVFSQEIVDLLLGQQWASVALPFAFLSATLYLSIGRRGCGALLQAMGRPHLMTVIHVLHATLLISAVWLVAPFGLTAVCASVFVVMALSLFLVFGIVRLLVNLSFRRIAIVHVRALALSAAIGGFGSSLRMSSSHVPGPVLLGFAVLAIGLLLILTLRFRPSLLLDSHSADLLRLTPIGGFARIR